VVFVSFVVPSATGVTLTVRVIPRARKTEFAGVRDDVLVVRVAAPPVEGAANDALTEFLAAACRIPRRAVRISAGASSRLKRISIDGVTADTIQAAIVK